MLLSDMGAEVIRIDRKGGRSPSKSEVTYRGRKAVALDMKKPEGVEAALRLIDKADALIEGFRPGVMDRLGIGYETLSAINPRLIFCSSSGWGSSGPYVSRPGQDILVQAMSGLPFSEASEVLWIERVSELI
jgi:alpha-methylacyl-CoA racemase